MPIKLYRYFYDRTEVIAVRLVTFLRTENSAPREGCDAINSSNLTIIYYVTWIIYIFIDNIKVAYKCIEVSSEIENCTYFYRQTNASLTENLQLIYEDDRLKSMN